MALPQRQAQQSGLSQQSHLSVSQLKCVTKHAVLKAELATSLPARPPRRALGQSCPASPRASSMSPSSRSTALPCLCLAPFGLSVRNAREAPSSRESLLPAASPGISHASCYGKLTTGKSLFQFLSSRQDCVVLGKNPKLAVLGEPTGTISSAH